VHIWIDADACPVAVKEILFRAAVRETTGLTLVANQALTTPPVAWIKSIRVGGELDAADKKIVSLLSPGDLVITSDIPLADEVISKQGKVLSPRGEHLTRENIKARLNMRDFMDTLRGSGIATGGPPALTLRDRKRFADNLDRLLTKSA